MGQTAKNFFFTIITICGFLLISLCLCEVVIRINNASKEKDRKVWIPDYYLGSFHARNNEFVFQNHDSNEFYAQQRTNDLGFIGGEVSVKKKNGVFRIVIMGDSFTEALQVDYQKNFCVLLENQLNQLSPAGKTYEVINAGMSRFSPITHYLLYKHRVAPLDADLIMVQLFANDIFEDNLVREMSIMGDDGLPVKIQPYFMKEYERRSRLKSSYRHNPGWIHTLHTQLMEISRFYEYMAVMSIKGNKNTKINRSMTRKPEFNSVYQFFPLQKDNPLNEQPEYLAKAWQQSFFYMTSLIEQVRKDNKPIVYFYIPMEGQLDLESYGDNSYQYYSGKRASLELNKKLAQFFKRQKVPFWDMLDVLQAQSSRDLYLSIDGHLTAEGHNALAGGLLRSLREFLTDL